MSLTTDVERGRLAADVLRNSVYVEAHEAIEKECIELWRSAKTPEEREHQWRMLQSLSKLRAVLQQTMDSGTLARKQLESNERRGLMSKLVSGR